MQSPSPSQGAGTQRAAEQRSPAGQPSSLAQTHAPPAQVCPAPQVVDGLHEVGPSRHSAASQW
jgi:hypothetical protein